MTWSKGQTQLMVAAGIMICFGINAPWFTRLANGSPWFLLALIPILVAAAIGHVGWRNVERDLKKRTGPGDAPPGPH